MAISTVSSVLRIAVRDWLPAVPRDEVCRVAIVPLPVEEIAGSRPASRAATKTSAQANTSTLPVSMDALSAGKIFPRAYQPLRRRQRQQHSCHTSGKRNQQALHQLFTNQGHPLRPKRAADCDFLLPRRGPRHQQVGDIQAANQQQAAYSAQQDDQRLLHILRKIV